MTKIELVATSNSACPNGKRKQTLEVRGVHERQIGIKAELMDGNAVYLHPRNYSHITVVRNDS